MTCAEYGYGQTTWAVAHYPPGTGWDSTYVVKMYEKRPCTLQTLLYCAQQYTNHRQLDKIKIILNFIKILDCSVFFSDFGVFICIYPLFRLLVSVF